MQHQYFIGIQLPNDFSDKIVCVQNSLYSSNLLLKPLVPHITLVHPNALADISPMILLPKIRLITKNLTIKLQLNDFDIFNNSILYIKVISPDLVDLQNQIVDLLPDRTKAKFYVGREYIPHITIAQTKPKIRLSPDLISNYTNLLSKELPFNFTVKSITKFNRITSREYSATTI